MSLLERVQLTEKFTAEDLNRLQTNIERALKRGRDYVTTSINNVTSAVGTGVVQATGGTMSTRALVPGEVVFGGADGLIDQDATFYWNTANGSLGLGTGTPNAYSRIHIYDSRAGTVSNVFTEPTRLIVQNPDTTGLSGIMFASNQGFPTNPTVNTWYERNAGVWFSGDTYPGVAGGGKMIFSVPQNFGGQKGFVFEASGVRRLTHTLVADVYNTWNFTSVDSYAPTQGGRTTIKLDQGDLAQAAEMGVTSATSVAEGLPWNVNNGVVLYKAGVPLINVAVDVTGTPTPVVRIGTGGGVSLYSLTAGGMVKAAAGTGLLSIGAAGTDYVVSVSVTAPITNTGTAANPNIGHATSGVTPGSYTSVNLTVDATGHITAAASGGPGTIYYQTIQNAGVAVTQQPIWNASTGLTAVNNGASTRTDVTVNLSTGIAGGQSAIGGTLTGQNLTLRSNLLDDGQIRLGSASYYFNQSAGTLNLGAASPGTARVIASSSQDADVYVVVANVNGGTSVSASQYVSTTEDLSGSITGVRQYGTAYPTIGLLAANVGELLHSGGTANFLISQAQAAGDVIITTTGSRTERMRVASGGNVSVANLSVGGMVRATAATGVLAIAVAGTDYQAPITWPASPRILVSTGAATVPTGYSTFTYTGDSTVSAATNPTWDSLLAGANTLNLTTTGDPVTTVRFVRVVAPTINTAVGLTVARAATVSISGAPSAGAGVTITNNYALDVVAGSTNLGASVFVGSLTAGGLVRATVTSGLLAIAAAGTDYEVPLTFSTGLTRTVNTITANISTGLAGGQTAYGGTAASENLTLSSTTHATKSHIIFGAGGSSGFNELIGQLYVGGSAGLATAPFVVTSSSNSTINHMIGNTSTGTSARTGLFLGQQTASVGGSYLQLFTYSAGFTASGLTGPDVGEILHVGAANFLIGQFSASGDIVFYTTSSRTERARIANGGNVSVANLTAGGVVYATAATGVLAIGTSAQIAAGITWPTAGQVLVSSGTTTAPVGDTHFTYDTSTDLLSINAGGTQAWYNLDGATNYERVRAFWSANAFNLTSEAGGTGVVRGMTINAAGGGLTIRDSAQVIVSGNAGSTPDMFCAPTQVSLRPTQTVASAAGATLDSVFVGTPGGTVITITDSTTISNAAGFNMFVVAQPTYVQSGAGSVIVGTAATMKINGEPLAGTDVTITNPYALWIDSGEFRLDGKIATSGSTATLGTTPGATAQNCWIPIICDGTTLMVPAWTRT